MDEVEDPVPLPVAVAEPELELENDDVVEPVTVAVSEYVLVTDCVIVDEVVPVADDVAVEEPVAVSDAVAVAVPELLHVGHEDVVADDVLVLLPEPVRVEDADALCVLVELGVALYVGEAVTVAVGTLDEVAVPEVADVAVRVLVKVDVLLSERDRDAGANEADTPYAVLRPASEAHAPDWVPAFTVGCLLNTSPPIQSTTKRAADAKLAGRMIKHTEKE